MSYLVISYFSNKDLRIQSQQEMFERVKEFWTKTEFEPEYKLKSVPFRGGEKMSIYFNGKYALEVGLYQDVHVQQGYEQHAKKFNFEMTIANEDLYQFGINFVDDVELEFINEHERMHEFLKCLPERVSIDSNDKLLDF